MRIDLCFVRADTRVTREKARECFQSVFLLLVVLEANEVDSASLDSMSIYLSVTHCQKGSTSPAEKETGEMLSIRCE